MSLVAYGYALSIADVSFLIPRGLEIAIDAEPDIVLDPDTVITVDPDDVVIEIAPDIDIEVE